MLVGSVDLSIYCNATNHKLRGVLKQFGKATVAVDTLEAKSNFPAMNTSINLDIQS